MVIRSQELKGKTALLPSATPSRKKPFYTYKLDLCCLFFAPLYVDIVQKCQYLCSFSLYIYIQICRTTLVFWTLQDLKAMKSPLGMESEGIVCLRLKSFTKTFFSGKRFYRFLICLLKESSP